MLVYIYLFIVVIVLFYFILNISINPEKASLFLIQGSLLLSGFILFGYSFYEEILIISILVMVLNTKSTNRNHEILNKNQYELEEKHYNVFRYFMYYLIFESIRGIIIANDLLKIRWVVFFVLMILVAKVFKRQLFLIIDHKQEYFVSIIKSIFLFFIVYLFSGLFNEFILQISRYDSQRIIWGTTAYTMFPILLGMSLISIFIITVKKNKSMYLFLFLMVITSFYYSSRIGLITVIMFSLLIFYKSSFKRKIGFGISFLSIIILIYFNMGNSSFDLLIGETFNAGQAAYNNSGGPNKKEKDIGRWLHMLVAYEVVTENVGNLIIGTGFRTSGKAISPKLYNLYRVFSPSTASKIRDDESTEGFTAFIVETGIIGVFLLLVNYFYLVKKVMLIKIGYVKIIIFTILLLNLFWLTVINILDVSLFYFIFMPYGIISQIIYDRKGISKYSILNM